MEIIKGNLNNFLINRYAYHKFYYIVQYLRLLLMFDNMQKMYYRKISIKHVNVTEKYAYQKKKKKKREILFQQLFTNF